MRRTFSRLLLLERRFALVERANYTLSFYEILPGNSFCAHLNDYFF
jgi:hypothetical protein